MAELVQRCKAVKAVFRNQNKRKFIWGMALVVVVFIVAVIAINAYMSLNLAPLSDKANAKQVRVDIAQGDSTSEIGGTLVKAGLIRNQRFFAWYVSYRHAAGLLRSGEYLLSPAQNMQSIIEDLRQGPPVVKVTIPEGFTTQQIVDLLTERHLINPTKFYDLVQNYDFNYAFLTGIPPSHARLDGFLFPATYDIKLGTSEKQIIELMLNRFQQELTPQIRQAAAAKGWSIRQLVTMASLIEREAKEAQDRAIISQVFATRLHVGMPLQSCASIEYLLGHRKPILSLEDLKIASPYNTYLHRGLPPGPIANPGDASIQAAAFPAQTDYLYFVAKPDGYHAFAKTYSEHLVNVHKYEH